MDDLSILLKRSEEKLKAAETLLEANLYSDAVSRAYYAMLYAARALLSSKGIHPKTHNGVMTKLASEYVNKGVLDRESFQLFASSQEDMEDADYGLLADISREEAIRITRGAEDFIEKIKRLMEGV
ncbi:MAG: HEPN domain-containing protein [Candidatus Altiarchaeota archaeon]|nr:HEPN domain-containing protein [Candidatus Altiarchaeota archaeon]